MKDGMIHLRGYSEEGSGRFADGDSVLDQARRDTSAMPSKAPALVEKMPSANNAYHMGDIRSRNT